MLFKHYKRLIVLPVLMCMSVLYAQDILEIKEKRVIAPDETFTVNEGTVVKMGPGAVLDVRGSLVVNGTSENPVRFQNMDDANPGLGIQISGIEQTSAIEIKGAVFNGLIQPLRFDPFWYRKSVKIQGVKIQNAPSYEPVVYLATPFIDLTEGSKIAVNVSGVDFINNASGMLVESYGSNGVTYSFDKLYFADNHISGGDATIGMLHLDFADVMDKNYPTLGNLAFERNDANGVPIGLSVSGSSSHEMNVTGVFGEDPLQVVFDQKRDVRVPMVQIAQTGSLADFGSISYVSSINHQYGELSLVSSGGLNVVDLLDGNGDKIDLTQVVLGDTQQYSYVQGLPVIAVLTDGRKIQLPLIMDSELPKLELTKIDTADYNQYLNSRDKVGEIAPALSDEIVVGFEFKIPTFKKKGEIVQKISQWEIGTWEGMAIYGGGDIKHKHFKDFATGSFKDVPLVKQIPVFSSMEWSYGLYGQYNVNTRFSAKANFYYTSISMHNKYSPAHFASGIMPKTIDQDFKSYTPKGNTYGLNFLTRMFILESEGQWHLRSYEIEAGHKSKVVPSIGLSAGLMHFTPYRTIWRSVDPSVSLPSENRRSAFKDGSIYNLRKLGSEGQNFLPGESPYSTIAALVGTSFSLSYLRDRWAFKGEIKFNYTSTDYLDDFGKGNWYGSNIVLLRENQKIGDLSTNYPNYSSSDQNLQTITPYDENVGAIAPRSTNGLNDWYYQAHIGISYLLFQQTRAVTIKDTTNYYEGLIARTYDGIIFGDTFTIPTFKKKGEVIEAIGRWEVGTWGGAAIYGGGDIRHKHFKDFATGGLKDVPLVNRIPVFSSMEWSYGLYGQYNVNTRFSAKANFYYTSISMHNKYSPAHFAAGLMPLTVVDSKGYQVKGSTYDINFLTRMYSIEGEGQWHLKSYRIDPGHKSKLVPSLGLSLGLMHFTPYRTIWRVRDASMYSAREHRKNAFKDGSLYNLRKLGSEGQNFLQGESPYSSIAAQVGTSFSLTYLRERWALKGEIRFNYTSTDYLDDFGKGNWYGGDIDLLRENQKIGDLSSNYPEANTSEQNLAAITRTDSNIGTNAPRSTNGLNDWYFQGHFGLSYRLFK